MIYLLFQRGPVKIYAAGGKKAKIENPIITSAPSKNYNYFHLQRRNAMTLQRLNNKVPS